MLHLSFRWYAPLETRRRNLCNVDVASDSHTLVINLPRYWIAAGFNKPFQSLGISLYGYLAPDGINVLRKWCIGLYGSRLRERTRTNNRCMILKEHAVRRL